MREKPFHFFNITSKVSYSRIQYREEVDIDDDDHNNHNGDDDDDDEMR